jgi:hypothetical protein
MNWKGFADSQNDTDFEIEEDDDSSVEGMESADKV